MYNKETIQDFAQIIKSTYNPFPVDDFVKSVMDDKWDSLELKGRFKQISANMRVFLPEDYPEAISILDKIVAKAKGGFFGIAFPDFVEAYGQDEKYWDISIAALELYTQYSSSEFAVRSFIINHEERMMAQMRAWAKHESEHVRRLASEGCRPRLPWAQALPSFKRDPSPILPILEHLKTDTSAYVRKSVANNLNDISKDNPDLVAKLAKSWYGKNELTDWIVKHGCRTLLKQANPEALAVFGFGDSDDVKASKFALSTKTVAIGDEFTFSFIIETKAAVKTRLEYAIDFVKANGKQSRKIFQISEIMLKANEKKLYEKTHSFVDLSTRKHYPGIHAIALIVNGVQQGILEFEVR